jgi:two-component system cell cycle response regulator
MEPVTGATVLVADDSEVVRAVLRLELEGQGHNVVTVGDGRAALDACRAYRPDVILLDVNMPGLDGYGVLEVLQADEELRFVPVVFLTSRDSTEYAVAALQAGAQDYLRKPFEPVELAARVAAAARVKRLRDELRRRNQELETAVRVDLLTGVYNRRHLLEQLDAMAGAARRHGKALGLLMVDVDELKAVNDRYGQAVGDLALKTVAERLRERVRGEDVVGRWDGEQFMVLLPGTDLEGAGQVAGRLLAAVTETPVPIGSGRWAPVTVSIGCAATQPPEGPGGPGGPEGPGERGGGDPEWLVRRADLALIAAKQAGRNRVELDVEPDARPDGDT